MEDVDLESAQFREALLKELNGQSEGMQTLVRLVDRRFQSHGRRMREHRKEHQEQRKRIEKLVLAGMAAAPGGTVLVLKLWETWV